MRRAQLFNSLAALVALANPILAASASITSVIPNQAHQCIRLCAWFNYQGNLPLALGCADPYENDCYCPTATESVSKASVAIEKCLSSRCAAGDYTRDLSSMRSIYAGYCKDAGYSQDAGVLGYKAADPTRSTTSDSVSSSSAPTTGQKTDASQASRTTQKTIVTQTKASGADGTSSPVVAQETETVFVDGASGSDSSGPSTAVKIGVGVGVPIAVLLIMAGVGLLVWRKRQAASRSKTESVVVEENGGSREHHSGLDKEVGAIKVSEHPLTRAELSAKEKANVIGGEAVNERERAGSYEMREVEVDRIQQFESYEVYGGPMMGVHEAHGNHVHSELPDQPLLPNATAELPGSDGQARHGGDGHLV
ncbi:hypothetical protein MY11210_005472 [Beauveria gryllotalpidicola]